MDGRSGIGLDRRPLKTDAMTKVSEKASRPGGVYSPHRDLFYTLHGGGYKMQEVWVFRYKPER